MGDSHCCSLNVFPVRAVPKMGRIAATGVIAKMIQSASFFGNTPVPEKPADRVTSDWYSPESHNPVSSLVSVFLPLPAARIIDNYPSLNLFLEAEAAL